MSLYGGIRLCGRPDLENVRRLDLLPMRSTMEMMRYGMALDIPHLEALTDTLTREINELRYEICSYIPHEKLDEFIEKSNMDAEDDYLPMNVESTKQMRKLLFEVLEVGKTRDLKLTKSGDISTGKRQMESVKKDHHVVRPVLKYRELSKLKGTYTVKLPRIARFHNHGECKVCGLLHDAPTMRVHTEIMWTRTSTSRAASKNPNLQNIPARSKYGKETRKAFVASPGKVIVGVDFSQSQLRILADRANEQRMIWIFQNNKDPHTMTAAWTFEVDELAVTKEQRDPSKNVNFALVFGETPRGLHEQLVSDSYGKNDLDVPDWLTLQWCENFFRKWHGIYTDVEPYMETQYYRARRYGCTWDMFGGFRRIPEVRSVHRRKVAEGLRQAGNNPIQAPDGGMMKLAMAEVQDKIVVPLRAEGIWCQPLMTIHDELLVETDEAYGQLVKDMMVSLFENVMVDKETNQNVLRVPIRASGAIMRRWEK